MEITPYNYSYANFVPKPDRRRQNLAVDVDRRSGVDRREVPRYVLAPDQNLTGVDPNTQFVQQIDRRQQNLSVDADRRAGIDRRQEARFVPLSFGVSNVPENTVFIGNILPENIPALRDFRSSFDSKAASKLNQPVFDTFNYSGKPKDINSNLNLPPPVNMSGVAEIKQNVIAFLSDPRSALKKTAEVFAAITTIIAGTEAISRLVSTITKKK